MDRRLRSLVPVAFAILVISACSPAPPQSTSSAATPAVTPTATPTQAPTATPTPTQAVPTQAPLGFTPGTKAAPRKVDIATDDQLTFWPNVVVVAEGETVTFNLTATGKAVHEFMIGPEADAIADKEGTPELEDIAAGTTKSLTFTFDGPGPYAFVCHAPGHFEAGMIGYIVVVGPDVPKAGTKDNPRLVEMSMDDTLKFMPDAVAATKGETVRFLLTNAGAVTHEFAVGPKDKVDADEVDGVVVKEADEITGHHLKVVDYTFDGPGPYGYACHEPGHFESGMFGDIVLISP
jgi:uncharacterized cupredoxin-like copper-binding protein